MTNVPRHHLPEAPLTDYSEAELRARVARAQMYVLEMRPVEGAGEPTPEQERDHLAYLISLEQQGRLYGAGPVPAHGGAPGYELAITVAESREMAEAYAANEPLARAGLVSITVTSHIINEGVACYFARALSRKAGDAPEAFAPGIDGIHDTLEQLRSRAAGAAMHIIRLKPGDRVRPRSDTEIGYKHFLWLRTNEMGAKLMSCGPFEIPHPDGVWGGGLAVVAAGAEEAEAIRAAEPSGVAEYRRLTVEPWTFDYGMAAPVAKALTALNGIS